MKIGKKKLRISPMNQEFYLHTIFYYNGENIISTSLLRDNIKRRKKEREGEELRGVEIFLAINKSHLAKTIWF